MEKLKNLVNPGSKKDDQVMYGSGRSDDPVQTGATDIGNAHTGSGQGSHFGSSRTAGHDPLSTSSNATGTSQYDSGTTTGTSQYGSGTTGGASHGLSEPYASRMPGGFDNDDAATTASVSSGVPGQSQSHSTMSGANDPTFTDKPLPREPASETGFGESSLTGNSYPDRSVGKSPGYGDQSGSSRLGRDAALGAGGIGTSTHRHEDPQRDDYAAETGRSFPLGGSSASDGYGSRSAGPHSSNLANKADPRVDSDGSRALGNSGYVSSSGGYGSGTDVTPSSGNQGSLGRDTVGAGAGAGAVGLGTTTGTGYGPESWAHEHQHHGHQYEGDPCETGAVGSQGGPHFVSGPHVTDTANRLDPHVGSGVEGAGTTDNSSGHHHHQHQGHRSHRGEEAALATGASGAGLGALEADRGKPGTTGYTTSSGLDPSNTDRRRHDTAGGGIYDNDRDTTTDASSTGKTAGPHKSDVLNKLDPRVDSDLSKQQSSHGGDHHYGRDAALTGAGGAGLYEAEKHHRGKEPNPATPSTTSGMSESQGRGHHQLGRDAALTGAGGAGLYEAEKHHRGNGPNLATSSTTSGMGGQSPYGSEVDPRVDSTRSGMLRDESAVSSAGSGHQPGTTSNHHYKRDAGLAGAGGTGAFGAEKHLGSSDRSDLAATPQDQLAGSGHQSATATSFSPYSSSSYGNGSQPQTGHHTERDLLAAGGVGLGATGGVDEAQKMRDNRRTDPGTQVRENQHPGASASTYQSSGYENDTEKGHHTGRHTGRDAALAGGAGTGALVGHENSQSDAAGYGKEPYQDTSRKHHVGRDAAILGGAAGAGGLAEHEYSKKDAERLQKEHAKEEKALGKEHSKEIKHHNKELAKEEKAHEKAIEKSEQRHEKAMEKDEKKQEHGEKKHGGLLGFLHRDKPDKELKEEERRHQAATPPGRGEEMAAGAGATGLESRSGYDPLQGEHGSQSGVHDTPIGIGSGPTTHDAYGAHDSGHNKLHKDPPAKVLESRGYEFQ